MAPESPHRLFKFRFVFLAAYLILWAVIIFEWLYEANIEFVPLVTGTAIIVTLQRRCGYDLRMLPTKVCPECGTPFDLPAQPQVSKS